MKFYQRALDGSQSYCETARSRATYFQNSDGDIVPVGELLDTKVDNDLASNSRIVRLSIPSSNESLPEPLPMPVMNFGEQEQVQNESDHLPLPCMNFEPKKDKDKKVNSDDLLPLPSMQF